MWQKHNNSKQWHWKEEKIGMQFFFFHQFYRVRREQRGKKTSGCFHSWNGTITQREREMQTHRGSSLSEEMINSSTGLLSVRRVLKILNMTDSFPWNRGSGERRPHRVLLRVAMRRCGSAGCELSRAGYHLYTRASCGVNSLSALRDTNVWDSWRDIPGVKCLYKTHTWC